MSEREWFPMHTIRAARDGRPFELKLRFTGMVYGFDDSRFREEGALGYYVIGSWSRSERGWFVVKRGARDITGGSGPHLDDEFDGWRNLPLVNPFEMDDVSNAVSVMREATERHE